MTLDELRLALPKLGFAVYAMDPGGAVTFEVITPEGETYAFYGATEQEAIDKAFPPKKPEPPPPVPSVFD